MPHCDHLRLHFVGMSFVDHPLTGTPFGTALDLCLILAALAWIFSVISREYSWVDRLWPICPPIYCLLVAAAVGFDSARLNLMTLLVVVWGARLTFNFARKGGFRKGGEDYRWEVVRGKLGPVKSQILNPTFISFGQMLLIWLFTSPAHQAWLWRDTPLTWIDGIAATLFVALFIGEAIADEQMWAFQQDKKRKIAASEGIADPFITTGLFRYCRHPNYLCELGMWWVFYLFAIGASNQWLHWTGLGCVLLTLLFVGSIRLRESISLERYPAYGDYQASTPCVVPLRVRRRKAAA